MRMPLTRYGLREIVAITAVAAMAATCLALLWLPGVAPIVVLWLALLAFFRDPERTIPGDGAALLSPADGVVHDVEEVDMPGDFLAGRGLRVGIFMSVFNVHVNRSPAAGVVRYVQHFPGRFHDARSPEAARANEHQLVGLELPGGRRILVNQIAGLVARRIVCPLQPGDRLEAGQRYGMVKFGSRLELIIPVEHKVVVDVQRGDKVKAGSSILARWEQNGA
jgi:phosphatidylserine decarboxylase